MNHRTRESSPIHAKLVLLQFISGEHHQSTGFQFVQNSPRESVAGRTGTTGQEDRLTLEIGHTGLRLPRTELLQTSDVKAFLDVRSTRRVVRASPIPLSPPSHVSLDGKGADRCSAARRSDSRERRSAGDADSGMTLHRRGRADVTSRGPDNVGCARGTAGPLPAIALLVRCSTWDNWGWAKTRPAQAQPAGRRGPGTHPSGGADPGRGFHPPTAQPVPWV